MVMQSVLKRSTTWPLVTVGGGAGMRLFTGPVGRSPKIVGIIRSFPLKGILEGGRKRMYSLVGAIRSSFSAARGERIAFPDPDTAVVASPDSTVRIPFGKASEARCRLNARALAALEMTPIAGFVPRALGGGRACGLPYYRESRLPGILFERPGKEAERPVRTAVEFVTAFHLQTARETVLDSRWFYRLFLRELRQLDAHLDGAGREKRVLLERSLRRQFLYAPCKTVWSHGSCRMENMLFDPSYRRVCGMIDWGLARRGGLPLLDIFSLLMHARSRVTARPVEALCRERVIGGFRDREESMLIERYVSLLRLPQEYVRPLLVMFWVHHAVRHPGSGDRNGTEETLEAALGVLRVRRGYDS